MIIVDTSALIDSLCGSRRSAPRLRELLADGERLVLPALVLYEWWRGPRVDSELIAQEALFPRESALPFGAEEAAIASRLYATLANARSRQIDLAIAAHALYLDCGMWTLNPRDFEEIPAIRLIR